MGSLELDTTERFHFHFSLSCIGEGNGNLLQCSCLENPRDGEAWWAAVYGAAQSWTRLKLLSSSSSMESIVPPHPRAKFILWSPNPPVPSAWLSSSVVYNSLRPHGLQHARPPFPSPTPRVYPNLRPLSR